MSNLVAELQAIVAWMKTSEIADCEDEIETVSRAADRIEALEREVRGLIDDAGHDAEAIAAGKDRIEALEADIQELTCGDVFLPLKQRIKALEAALRKFADAVDAHGWDVNSSALDKDIKEARRALEATDGQ